METDLINEVHEEKLTPFKCDMCSRSSFLLGEDIQPHLIYRLFCPYCGFECLDRKDNMLIDSLQHAFDKITNIKQLSCEMKRLMRSQEDTVDGLEFGGRKKYFCCCGKSVYIEEENTSPYFYCSFCGILDTTSRI